MIIYLFLSFIFVHFSDPLVPIIDALDSLVVHEILLDLSKLNGVTQSEHLQGRMSRRMARQMDIDMGDDDDDDENRHNSQWGDNMLTVSRVRYLFYGIIL